ncbi:MAG: hypothetical protein CMI00_12345 [Oceanospirillaceae bacterium]|nr:hypothetical protein [Oceanospirillaceae bacterium]|tara:strand:- start:574 stop:1419 length:846 start_codon:yes stop_codon:yes gene_type:complete
MPENAGLSSPAKPALTGIYLLIAEQAESSCIIRDVTMGLAWTCIQVEDPATGQLGSGLCFSPTVHDRNIPWSGTLTGKPVNDLLPWLQSWHATETAVAIAAANAVLSMNNPMIGQATPIPTPVRAITDSNLSVFQYFAPRLRETTAQGSHSQKKNVTIIGRYPGIDKLRSQFDFAIIEQNPQGNDYPAVAADYVLPDSDWVFITASSLFNKTLPHLLSLSQNAEVVLMGPTMPWLAQWKAYGVDHLAGVEVKDYELLKRIAMEGGGTRIFDEAVEYRVLGL